MMHMSICRKSDICNKLPTSLMEEIALMGANKISQGRTPLW